MMSAGDSAEGTHVPPMPNRKGSTAWMTSHQGKKQKPELEVHSQVNHADMKC